MADAPTFEQRFAALVLEHQAGLRAFIRMLGVDTWQVDDLAQETFLVAHRRMDELDPELPAGPWLRAVARNLVCNHRRSVGRWAKLVQSGLVDELAAAEEGVDQASRLHLDELVQHLRDCLERLPAHGRALLAERYGTPGELALVADRSPNAQRQALFRVRETLRRCLTNKVGEVEL